MISFQNNIYARMFPHHAGRNTTAPAPIGDETDYPPVETLGGLNGTENVFPPATAPESQYNVGDLPTAPSSQQPAEAQFFPQTEREATNAARQELYKKDFGQFETAVANQGKSEEQIAKEQLIAAMNAPPKKRSKFAQGAFLALQLLSKTLAPNNQPFEFLGAASKNRAIAEAQGKYDSLHKLSEQEMKDKQAKANYDYDVARTKNLERDDTARAAQTKIKNEQYMLKEFGRTGFNKDNVTPGQQILLDASGKTAEQVGNINLTNPKLRQVGEHTFQYNPATGIFEQSGIPDQPFRDITLYDSDGKENGKYRVSERDAADFQSRSNDVQYKAKREEEKLVLSVKQRNVKATQDYNEGLVKAKDERAKNLAEAKKLKANSVTLNNEAAQISAEAEIEAKKYDADGANAPEEQKPAFEHEAQKIRSDAAVKAAAKVAEAQKAYNDGDAMEKLPVSDPTKPVLEDENVELTSPPSGSTGSKLPPNVDLQTFTDKLDMLIKEGKIKSEERAARIAIFKKDRNIP